MPIHWVGMAEWLNLKRKETKMKNRIEKFFEDLRADCSDYEIAAGLGNADIAKPDWMAISEGADHLKAWDIDDPNASAHLGFVYVSYEDDQDLLNDRLGDPDEAAEFDDYSRLYKH